MKPNLRVGLTLSNQHDGVSDGAAFRLIADALEHCDAPGEVIVALYAPDGTVWAFTIESGPYELRREGDGWWEATPIEP